MADPKPRRVDVVDTVRALAALAGIALVGYGAWLHYPPLGFVSAGLMLAAIGVVAALRAR